MPADANERRSALVHRVHGRRTHAGNEFSLHDEILPLRFIDIHSLFHESTEDASEEETCKPPGMLIRHAFVHLDNRAKNG